MIKFRLNLGSYSIQFFKQSSSVRFPLLMTSSLYGNEIVIVCSLECIKRATKN